MPNSDHSNVWTKINTFHLGACKLKHQAYAVALLGMINNAQLMKNINFILSLVT